MASTSPSVRGYIYIICRLKFTEDIKSLAPSSLFCHYGETNDLFPIGGLVDIDETPIAASLRHLRELAGFRLAYGLPMFPCNSIDGYKDREPIRVRLYVTDVLWDHCRYRNSYNTLTLGNKITADRNRLERHNIVGFVNHFAAPTTVPCPMIEDFMIPFHNWDANDVKSSCFDYREL